LDSGGDDNTSGEGTSMDDNDDAMDVTHKGDIPVDGLEVRIDPIVHTDHRERIDHIGLDLDVLADIDLA
jgi:hypothetical protein